MACWRRGLSLPQVAHIQCCFQGPNCGAVRIDPYGVYRGWRITFRANENLIHIKLKKQLECLMPSISTAKSIPASRSITITLELPIESMGSYSRFITMMMLHYCQRMLHDRH